MKTPYYSGNKTEGMRRLDTVDNFSKVTPARMIQSVVDHLYSYHDLCGVPGAGVGGFTDGIGTMLCERLAAFDVPHNHMLSEEDEKTHSGISKSDLKFLKMAYQSCRISTQRFWDYPSIAHVNYVPTQAEVEYLNKAVNLTDWKY
ncbi:hypothetical protein Bealeia1_00740 [Candidatus Bealeia paramacronuclearis]|uniref:Uncharacterized protein n=1 Tax=Candidatus Bealeia paramacronuclearis TaxID=1921001 RepID=A0ABZ2C252_9PROT|nr:hypothetical protein [Candidatus Bealeia paramacronuclearis]